MFAKVFVPRVVYPLAVVFFLSVATAWSQGSPWEISLLNLELVFTTTVARAFALVAIVLGGVALAYGEGMGKRVVGGVVMGIGMMVGAINFLHWIAPYGG
jgi:type IV secretory pathway VirB2 component (pilin)